MYRVKRQRDGQWYVYRNGRRHKRGHGHRMDAHAHLVQLLRRDGVLTAEHTAQADAQGWCPYNEAIMEVIE